jgi:hypothetical protein
MSRSAIRGKATSRMTKRQGIGIALLFASDQLLKLSGHP